MTLSCRDCPSFVSQSDWSKASAKPVEADFCAKYGRVLSIPGKSDEINAQICENFAESCPAYGEQITFDSRALPAMRVSLGIQSLSVPTTGTPPAACTSCANYVNEVVVEKELGWKHGMCAAKGRLMFRSRLVQEAGQCSVGTRGAQLDTTEGIELADQYGLTGGTINMGNQFKAAASYDLGEEIKRHSIDPRQYVTDKPVTPEDEAQCIRAWRQVNDPEGLREPVFLPIFDGVKLCGFDPRTTYGEHRPDLYVDHHGVLYDLAVEMWELRETPLLIGGAGTGKTETACWFARLLDLPFWRVSISKGTEDYHLAGEKTLEVDPATGQSVTLWKNGRLAENISLPSVGVIDEPNLKSDIFEFIRPLVDNARQLVLDANQGEVRKRHDLCFIMLAQNPSDDPIYAGTEPLSAADTDRLSPIFFGLPDDATERAIIRKHCADAGYQIPDLVVDKIMQVADTLRSMIADGDLQISWGLRPQIKVAKKTRFYSLEKAYKRALIDGMERSVVDMVLGVVRGVA